MTADRLHDLIVRHFDGRLSPAEAAELSAALCDDPAALQTFADVSAQIMALAGPRPAVVGRRRNWGNRIIGLVVGLAAAIAVAVYLYPRPIPPAEPGPLLLAVERPLGLVRGGPGPNPLAVGDILRAGHTVSTVGTDSAVVLRGRTGTRLFLAGDTALTFAGDGGPRVDVGRGDVDAEVSVPRDGAPFRIATPEATVEAHGARLLVARDPGRTQVKVVSGVVRIADPETDEVVTMGSGDWAEVGAGGMRVLPRPSLPPEAFAVRFDGTLPDGWRAGEFVADDPPAGSRGAVRAVPRQGGPLGVHHQIVSANGWTAGLFAVQPDTWISVRFRVAKPGFFHLLMVARAKQDSHLPAVVLEAPHFWERRPVGEWQTVHLPADKFKVVERFAGAEGPLVATLLVFDSQVQDVGLTVDRVWVTRGSQPGPYPE